MKLSLLAVCASLVTASAPARERSPDYQEVAVADAIAYWTRLCVATMPDRRAFAAALAADAGWVQFRKREGGHPVLGLFWRSPRGELSYQDTPLPTETNQGCHYTFRTGAGFTHDDASRALASTLGLEGGRPAGTARRASTRWEGTLPNGTRVRVFLSSSASEMDGPAATLSISAYRAAPPRR